MKLPKQEIGNINPFGISKDPVLKKQYEESIEAQKNNKKKSQIFVGSIL